MATSSEEDVKCDPIDDVKIAKKTKPGLIYLSSIPPTMNVTLIRRRFEEFGELGRVFLQPNLNEKKKGKAAKSFTEGWIEFKRKRIAKNVAKMLNNNQVGGKRRSRYYDTLWNIKYLSGFKWTHLTEKLAYEKAVHNQRLRTEISQVKREANFYAENVNKKKRMEKSSKKKVPDQRNFNDIERTFKQTPTDEQVRQQKSLGGQSNSLLQSIFTGGTTDG